MAPARGCLGTWAEQPGHVPPSWAVASGVTTGAASSSKQNATRRAASKRVVQFWDEHEGGELSLLAGVCKSPLAPLGRTLGTVLAVGTASEQAWLFFHKVSKSFRGNG